jgi:ATP-dependent RNA helicase RhlE
MEITMTFQALGLIDPLLRAIEECGYRTPSAIQSQAIPLILKGHDLLGSAQTGTGKTASFILPILQQMSMISRAKNNRTRVLILTPTRELAAQVHESAVQYGAHLNSRATVVFGGVKINPQMMKLRSGTELLIATPGRLLDLHHQNAIHFDDVETFVLDEADRMLDMGFIHDIKRIIKLLPHKRQNLMFSATFSDEIRTLAKNILSEPKEIDVAPRNTTLVTIKQTIHPVDKSKKSDLLSHLIHSNRWGQTLVFARTKHGANKLVKQLAEAQIHALAIHGNKSQSQRTKALAEFKAGEVHVLVATDIAARGIDIDALPVVVNFDLPQVPEDYVHRIGRTARAGASGLAVSLVSADEASQLYAIEKLLKQTIEHVLIDDFEPTHSLPSRLTSKPRINSSAHPGVRKSTNNNRNKSTEKNSKKRFYK